MSSAIPSSQATNHSPDPFIEFSDQPVLGQEPLASTFQEKRSYPRFPFRGRAKAIIVPSPRFPSAEGAQDSEVVTNDLSRGGVSILHRTQLLAGQRLMLMLNDKPQLVEVRWCCQVWDHLFAAGCCFLSEPRGLDIDEQLTAIDVVIASEACWTDGESSNDQKR